MYCLLFALVIDLISKFALEAARFSSAFSPKTIGNFHTEKMSA
jgi:hypothetical protein